MIRRDFLKFLGLATIAVTATNLSGIEVIQVIAEGEKVDLTDAEIVALELERIRMYMPTLFNQDSVFFDAISRHPVQVVAERSMRIPLEIKPGSIF